MTKRKANVSVDEWLSHKVEATESIQNLTTATPVELTVTPESTEVRIDPATGTVQAASTEPVVALNHLAEAAHVAEGIQVAEDQVDVALRESDAAEWFWLLLEQAGFERW